MVVASDAGDYKANGTSKVECYTTCTCTVTNVVGSKCVKAACKRSMFGGPCKANAGCTGNPTMATEHYFQYCYS